MAKVVNIHEAKTHLSRLVQEVIDGHEVIIARANKPVVRLVRLDSARPRPVLGTAKGLVTMRDDFEEPLPDFEDYA